MTTGKSAKSEQRTTAAKATEYARRDKAPDLEGAGGEKDSEVIQSAVAALGAAVFGAGVGEEEELERARKRGMHMDVDGGDAGAAPRLGDSGSAASGRADATNARGRAGTRATSTIETSPADTRPRARHDAGHEGMSAEALERSYREARPGQASARQADPNAAPTPLQRLEEDDDLN